MFRARSLLLFLVCWAVGGQELSRKSAQFDPIELQGKRDVLKKVRSISWESTAEREKVITSNITQNIINQPGVHLDDINIWNPYIVAKIWSPDKRKLLNVTIDCEEDITVYMTAVLAGQQWALKSK